MDSDIRTGIGASSLHFRWSRWIHFGPVRRRHRRPRGQRVQAADPYGFSLNGDSTRERSNPLGGEVQSVNAVCWIPQYCCAGRCPSVDSSPLPLPPSLPSLLPSPTRPILRRRIRDVPLVAGQCIPICFEKPRAKEVG